ncbi:MAG: LPP20 family lipoprotein [Bacteroidetes bacterium]|nr:LPP20 family lipoprotein [Bacteroidota bacterium]
MRFLHTFFAVAMLAVLIGCGGSKPLPTTDTGDVPDWYSNVPSDPNYLFAVNTSTSKDMQLAVDKAVQAARAEIARQVELKMTGLQKRFQEETGIGDDSQLLDQFTQASKSVVSTSLTGSKEKQKKIVKDGNNWRAYVLMEYPLGAAQQALREQIKKNEQLFTRFQAAKTYKELDDEVSKYEQSKANQPQ